MLDWGDAAVTQLSRHCDVFVIQAERWLVEDKSPDKPDFTSKVVRLSKAIREGNPNCRIFVEAGRRLDRGGGTADEFIHAFALLHAKDPQIFDGMYLFITRQPTTDNKQGLGALRQMIAWMRIQE